MSDTAALKAGALGWMKAHVNLAEKPWGSNIVPLDGSTLWQLVGKAEYQGQPWCAATVTYAYLKQGVDLRKVFGNPYYCPTLEAVARQRGWWKVDGGNAGDLVLYGTNGQSVHVGMSAPAPGDLFYAYEGNTSPGNAGSQANGGGLYYRGRPRSFIRGWIDMARVIDWMTVQGLYAAPAARKTASVAPAAPAPFPLPAGHWYGVDDGSNASHSGRNATDAANIRLIQKTVGVGQDGSYGPATARAVQLDQVARHLAADGQVGPKTWAALGIRR